MNDTFGGIVYHAAEFFLNFINLLLTAKPQFGFLHIARERRTDDVGTIIIIIKQRARANERTTGHHRHLRYCYIVTRP